MSHSQFKRLVELGNLGFAHLHQFVGGEALNATMHPADAPADHSSCTSCLFTEDFSNYWTPVLYYQARNGSFKRVKQLGGLFYESAHGGFVVAYYNNGADGNIAAFPQGFHMRYGDPTGRGPEARTKFPNITYVCLEKHGARLGSRITTEAFPTKPCKAGMLTRMFLPECWDGKNLDSPDHASHVSERMGYTWLEGGVLKPICPPTHPVQIPQVAIEIHWDTTEFNNEELWGWRGEGKHPFVWSSGDRDGWALHADYVFGWRGDSLHLALSGSECKSGGYSCANLKEQTIDQANKCIKAPMVREEVDGWLDELSGGNKVWE